LGLAQETAAEAERERRLAPGVIALLRESGLGSLAAPASLGGSEIPVILESIRQLAAADGSAGWVGMIYATSSAVSHYLTEAALEEVFGSEKAPLLSGVLAPRGMVEPTPGGFLLTGRWPFASGCVDADWIGLGAVDRSGAVKNYLIPIGEVEVIDTWDAVGLRASASHDVALSKSPVPAHRVFDLSIQPPGREAATAFPIFGLLAAGIGAVALGIAAAAISTFSDLAGEKTPTGSRRRLAERGAVQEAVARAGAAVGAARSYLDLCVDGASNPATPAERARLRGAATHAVAAAGDATDLVFSLAGGSAVYTGSRLQRHMRDLHAAGQHMMVGQPTWELVGRVLLGVETDIGQL
jgi:alkylation response protein AidB-like acyl-CoA dehydrogenase